METGLFEIQADHLSGFRKARNVNPASREALYALLERGRETVPSSEPTSAERAIGPTAEIARCFLRLANRPNFALDRLSRYEAALWRQVGQTLFALDALDRRKPQERLRVGGQQELSANRSDDAQLGWRGRSE